MRRVNFPTRRDQFDPLDLNKRNNDLGRDGEMDIETLEVHVRQLQKAVGAKFDATDTTSHEARLRVLAQAIDDSLSEVGDGLGREGKQVFVLLGSNLEFVPSGPGGSIVVNLKTTITGDHSIVGYLTTSKAVRAEDGHGQFIDAPSFSAGKSNLRNGITRYYCIDTANHIEIESPEAIASNRKQYLQDKDGKIPVEESDGMIGSEGGFKVNDVQVVGERISGWTAPVGSYDRTGGFDADNPDLGRLAQFVAALYYDLAAHGLIGED